MPSELFISADWSKHAEKRSVHVVDRGQRRIWPEYGGRWDLSTLLDLARRLGRRGPVLVGVDLALGVPAGYWAEVRGMPRWRDCSSFVDWLRTLEASLGFFDTVRSGAEWRLDRPFFHVPKGEGGLRSITGLVEGGLRRRIDVATGAKPMFAVSGIPGTVGSGTRDFWIELNQALGGDREFAFWPFEGKPEDLLASRKIVLAETYPGLAYAAALEEELPTRRLIIGKTKRAARERACDLLEEARWHREAGVELGDLTAAREDEDAFDSHLTAVAVLRCAVEGRPLCDPAWVDIEAEGAMLLAGPVDPAQRATSLRVDPRAEADVVSVRARRRSKSSGRKFRPRRRRPAGSEDREYLCPIPGCTKVFHGSRGGWDGHVGSLRIHPEWYPEVDEPEARKRLFKKEFGDWLR